MTSPTSCPACTCWKKRSCPTRESLPSAGSASNSASPPRPPTPSRTSSGWPPLQQPPTCTQKYPMEAPKMNTGLKSFRNPTHCTDTRTCTRPDDDTDGCSACCSLCKGSLLFLITRCAISLISMHCCVDCRLMALSCGVTQQPEDAGACGADGRSRSGYNLCTSAVCQQPRGGSCRVCGAAGRGQALSAQHPNRAPREAGEAVCAAMLWAGQSPCNICFTFGNSLVAHLPTAGSLDSTLGSQSGSRDVR